MNEWTRKSNSFDPECDERVEWKYLGLCKETQFPLHYSTTLFPNFSPTYAPFGDLKINNTSLLACDFDSK